MARLFALARFGVSVDTCAEVEDMLVERLRVPLPAYLFDVRVSMHMTAPRPRSFDHSAFVRSYAKIYAVAYNAAGGHA